VQANLPVVRLRRRGLPRVERPVADAASRLVVGGALGAVFGAATLHCGFWAALGAGMAVAVGALRDRAG
jgi:hypothetical protein